jgi:hypothetical protein
MYFDELEAFALVDEYDREARRAFELKEARRLTTIEPGRQRVRFPVPQWLRRAPFVLRATTR